MKIFVAGSRGMVGSAIIRQLHAQGSHQLLTPSRDTLDLLNQQAVRHYLRDNRPEVVIIAAAKVGGIWANANFPAEFLYENLMIECNLIHESHKAGINRLLFLGSTCIYPKFSPQPIPEEALLTSALEPTNEGYALAKIAGVKLCTYYRNQYGRNYISAMPTNLYGPGDNYHPKKSHVIPGLIGRFHEAKERGAKEVTIWGTGRALRDFLFVDDLAEALLFLLDHYHDPLHINIGSGEEISILEAAELVAQTVGFEGEIRTDPSTPDGTPRKIADISRITQLGWKPKTPLKEGLKLSYEDFCKGSNSRNIENIHIEKF